MPCWPDCDETLKQRTKYERNDLQEDLQEALRVVETSPCNSGNTVHGAATVTVLPTGHVGELSFAELEPPRDDVRECLRQKYMTMRVRPFDGPTVTASFRF